MDGESSEGRSRQCVLATDLSNFIVWETKTKAALDVKELGQHSGMSLSESRAEGVEKSARAKGIVLLTLSDYWATEVSAVGCAGDILRRMRREWVSTIVPRQLALSQQLNQTKQLPGERIAQYLARGRALLQLLEAIDAGLPSAAFTALMLNGLREEFKVTVQAMGGTGMVHTIGTATPILLQAESELLQGGQCVPQAFAAQQPRWQQPQQSQWQPQEPQQPQ